MYDRFVFGLGVSLQVLTVLLASPAIAADEVASEPAAVSTEAIPAPAIPAPIIESNVVLPPAPPEPQKGFIGRLFAKRPYRQIIVNDPYMAMRSGAGVGYPIVHVAGRDEKVEVLKRRTDWFYIRTSRQYEGWVEREQILSALETTGEPVDIKEPLRTDYTTRSFEGGLFAGRFGGASLLSVYGGYGWSDHLTAELTLSKSLGHNYDATLASIGLTHVFAPEWIASPYFGLGTGVILTEPHATIAKVSDSTDQMAYFAAGARGYLARRFMWRVEYRRNTVFTSRDENDQVHEWKLGFAFFL